MAELIHSLIFQNACDKGWISVAIGEWISGSQLLLP